MKTGSFAGKKKKLREGLAGEEEEEVENSRKCGQWRYTNGFGMCRRERRRKEGLGINMAT